MNSLDTRIFCKVAETLSFQEAGRTLAMSRSAVSKRIAKLERELGTTLINRTPRSLSLTESGRTLLAHCRTIDEAIENAELAVMGQDRTPAGTVLLSAPTSLGVALLPSIAADFTRCYPQVRLSSHFSDACVNIVAGGFDLAIRIAQKLSDSRLVARRLATSDKVLVASPGYLSKHGAPTHVNDLARHACLGLGHGHGHGRDDVVNWHFQDETSSIEVPVELAFTANHHLALKLAACLDMGLLYTPRVLVSGELSRGRLQVVLPEYCMGIEYGVFAVCPQKHPPAKVRAVIDFIKDRLGRLHEDPLEPNSRERHFP